MIASIVLLVALGVSSASAASCPNAAFRTGASASLPDCRAYELVTTQFAGGQVPEPATAGRVFLDGSNIMLSSLGAFGNPGDNVGAGGADYRVVRGASGWAAAPIEPTASLFQNAGQISPRLQDVGQGFEKTLFNEVPVSSKAIDTRLYVRQPEGTVAEVGPMVPQATVAAWEPNQEENVPNVKYRGASQDLLHVFFGSERAATATDFLWPGDTTLRAESIYEYVGLGNSAPKLVGVDSSGHLISQCGTGIGHYESGGGKSDAAFNAISSNGAVVFFTSVAASVCGGSGPPVGELFARINGTSTVAISEPSPNSGCTTLACTGAPLSGGRFEGASADGSKIFFTSTQQLLDQASEDNASGDGADNGTGGVKGCAFTTGANGCNLYEYDFANPVGHNLVLLSGGDTSGNGPQVQGVSRVSLDGSRVYFVAKGVLTAAPNGQGHVALAGAENLYVYERDTRVPAGRTTFIATLASPNPGLELPGDSRDWSIEDSRPVEATSPDGRFLLFASINDLTPDASGSGVQLYRYDAQTGGLIRVSIGQNGFDNNGNVAQAATFPIHAYSAEHSGSLSLGPQGVAISEDGAYVFFSSSAGLTPQAINDPTETIANIYEYHGGQVYLISDGQDRHLVLGGSAIIQLGANSSGSDFFFETADQLLPQDTNTQRDVYDARIFGGFPPPTTAAPCTGEACRAGPASPPVFGAPPSSTFSGAGNLSPPASTPVKPKTASQIKAEKLAKALKACRAKHNKHQRAICEAQARKKYGPAHKSKKTHRRVK